MTILITFIIYIILITAIGWYFDGKRISKSNRNKIERMISSGLGKVLKDPLPYNQDSIEKMQSHIKEQMDLAIMQGILKPINPKYKIRIDKDGREIGVDVEFMVIKQMTW